MEEKKTTPNYLFEVSWEVCNKIGGIHTVLASKARTVTSKMGDRYITIGPDVFRDGENREFVEDGDLLKQWRQTLLSNGLRVKIGRWNVAGSPIAVIVDYSAMFSHKDEILKFMWETYRVDSLSGQWDYVEPVLFGCAAAKIIQSFAESFAKPSDTVVAHFHEWMTVSGVLCLRRNAPRVATVFTTHATVLGRSIASNNLPLYGEMSRFNADELARQFNVVAKHSLEKNASRYCDDFLTVSQTTADECRFLLDNEVDDVTPNGFDSSMVWRGEEYDARRGSARERMIRVAEALYGVKYEQEPLIVATSGRYEYHNKGLDVFINSLKSLAERTDLKRSILAYITVPAAVTGVRTDLVEKLTNDSGEIDASKSKFLTHNLENEDWDMISQSVVHTKITDSDSNVKVVFVPTYLDGRDGVFDMSYYHLLTGVDVTVYPSYYEPWGYTPLESVAFYVPTITTSLAGFGRWVELLPEHDAVEVVRRDDYNTDEVVQLIADDVTRFAAIDKRGAEILRGQTQLVARSALWERLYSKYEEAYARAITSAMVRVSRSTTDINSVQRTESLNFMKQQLSSEKPSWNRVMVEKHIPQRLRPLEELSLNLWWSWTSDAKMLFESIDPQLWVETEKNPIVMLDKLDVDRLHELGKDADFLARMDGVYSRFRKYMDEQPRVDSPRIAYFSMEYGLHSSLKIYSGGLGVLAGDYLKEASDKNTPMVAVGILYRYGYFTQRLSSQGAQEASYEAQNFNKLPISQVRDENGSWVSVRVPMPGRTLTARLWLCQVGRTPLYLLDTDFEANIDEDRQVTHYLYGGDWENRLKQEILLGIGGIKALRQLGIKQDVYHCNEGHAAFIGLERMRDAVQRRKLAFSEAMEVVRSSSLFTTHTPVPAGHDAFPESMVRQYLSYMPDMLGIGWEQFFSLGKNNPNDANEKFSMSILACNLSQEVNGVSWLHGEVSKDILGGMWPGYFHNELHIGYVTNGVHFPTWASSRLKALYAKYFGQGFSAHEYDIPAWQGAKSIPSEELWAQRMLLKETLINYIRRLVSNPSQVRVNSPRQIVQVAESLSPNVLTIGFARRFATYKRAYLLFTDLKRLSAIVNNPQRPVQFVFAGKAHPNDKPGQDLIRRIVEVSLMPEFVGKIIFLPNYDMELARKMVQGVDVWLNTPTRPLEASGTSGEKCVMNGVLQFSVLDGWWVEGYRPSAGWMLPMERTFEDQHYQDELDAEMIYNTIEEQIVPTYYNRSGQEGSYSAAWCEMIKSCIADVAANFTMNRQLRDYEVKFYGKLAERRALIEADDYRLAREIAAWKRKVSAAWDSVKVLNVNRIKNDKEAIFVGVKYNFEVTLSLGSLSVDDIGVELVVANSIETGRKVEVLYTSPMQPKALGDGTASYSVEMEPRSTGTFDIAIRIYPKNDLLPHRMDFALVKWA